MNNFTQRFLALQPKQNTKGSMVLFIELLGDVTGLPTQEVKEKLSFLLQDVVEGYGEEVSDQIYIMNRSQKPSEFIREYLDNLSPRMLPNPSKIKLNSGKEVKL